MDTPYVLEASTPSVEEMLQDFVDDFRTDPCAARPITFGIRVKDAERPDWYVPVEGWEGGEPEAIRFGDGAATRELHGGNGVLFYYQPGSVSCMRPVSL